VQASRDELVDLLARALREDGELEPLHSIYDPVFCVIAQGSKEVFLRNERYVYDPSHYLLVTAELPLVSHVFESRMMTQRKEVNNYQPNNLTCSNSD
jgi:hypothetical protein